MPRTAIEFCVLCLSALVLGAASVLAADAPATQPAAKMLRLWEGDAPGAKGKELSEKPSCDVPNITVYSPPAGKNNGMAIVICPGGGYGALAGHEGKPVAEWANQLGATGVVLRYRLGPKYGHPVMMNDVNRAVRMTRAKAAEWGIDPNRIGVLGFSAGGHLASTAITHWDKGDASATDPIEKVSSRPDFGVLIYPVITMTSPFTHAGSRKNLLGAMPDEKLIELMSNEKQVNKETPPTYLVHSSDDKAVPVENALMFATALARCKVPFGMRVFDHGGHGYGMGAEDAELSGWPDSCAKWLEKRGFFKSRPAK
jgi:acetyl esterase/lipase